MKKFTPTLFQILDLVKEDSTEKEIKDAFRKLIKEYHPDLNQDRKEWAEEKTKKLNEAYQILSNPEKRKQYKIKLETHRAELHFLKWEEQQKKFRLEELRTQQLIIQNNTIIQIEKRKQQREILETGAKFAGGALAIFALVSLIDKLSKE